jgi:hypothetical protein
MINICFVYKFCNVRNKLRMLENRDREDKSNVFVSSYVCLYTIAKDLFIGYK